MESRAKIGYFYLVIYFIFFIINKKFHTLSQQSVTTYGIFAGLNFYKSNSSPIDKESTGIAVESGAFIRNNERAFPEI